MVYSFSASPSPIIAPTLTGATTITAVTSCEIDIRAGDPNGKLLKSGKYLVVAPTGDTVRNGAVFFLQLKGNTSPQGTLATLTVPVLASAPLCEVSNFSATPNPVFSPIGVAVTTIVADAACQYDVRVLGPSGPILFSGAGAGTRTTGLWVSHGMTFYLQLRDDATPQGTLQTLTVGVQP